MSKDRPTLANDGYTRADGYSKLAEGYIRKGGTNTPTSQVQTRPPPPASMQPKPAAPQGGGPATSTPIGTKQG